MKYGIDLCEKTDCSDEENAIYERMSKQGELPADIIKGDGGYFYKVKPLYNTPEELQEYCTLMQTKYLHTIKNCVVFFTTLAVISLVISFLAVVFA